jgi:hypothetical protein
MFARTVSLLVVVGIAAVAAAEPPKGDAATQLGTLAANYPGVDIQPDGTAMPRVLSYGYGATTLAPVDDGPNVSPIFIGYLKGKAVGFSADHKAGWIAADVSMEHYCIAMGCPPRDPNPTLVSVVMVAELGRQWQPLAVAVRVPASDKDALAGGPPTAIARTIEPGAEDLAKLFDSSLGAPAAFAATVSPRKETTLYGSGPGEKSSGGAAVSAKIVKWALAIKVHDGVAAGVTANKQLGWAFANVDVRPVKTPAAKPVPYRLTVIYERVGTAWQAVAIQFSIEQRL